jgi:hypothetical protein
MVDTIRYKISSGGNAGTWCRGSVVDLLIAMPYLVPHSAHKALPDLSQLNEILSTGKYDCGMSGGCEWKPFQIDKQDYKTLEIELLELITQPHSIL